MNIFVGNLSAMTTATHLSDLFFRFGKVVSVRIIRDRNTGRSLGFGFVKMDKRAGASAIKKLNSMNFMNCFMQVNEAAAHA